MHPHRHGEVLVEFALERRLVVEEIAARVVEQRQMQRVEQIDRVGEAAHRRMREHLPVDQPPVDNDLRPVGGDEIDAVRHRGELRLQRVEAPARRRHEADPRIVQAVDELEGFLGKLALGVEHGAVHIAGDELDALVGSACVHGFPFFRDALRWSGRKEGGPAPAHLAAIVRSVPSRERRFTVSPRRFCMHQMFGCASLQNRPERTLRASAVRAPLHASPWCSRPLRASRIALALAPPCALRRNARPMRPAIPCRRLPL